jgi:hypothetical protein
MMKRLPAIIVLLAAAAALACPVAVYRYALLRWAAPAYRATVFHNGPLTPEQQKALESLRQLGGQGGALDVQALDTRYQRAFTEMQLLRASAGTMPATAPAGAESPATDPPLPRLVVQYPEAMGRQHVLWAGALTPQAVAELADSPARRKIVDAISRGDVAAWILLESGDPQRDDQAAATLERALSQASATLRIPDDLGMDISEGGAPTYEQGRHPHFSVIRASRTAPQERLLATQVLDSVPARYDGPVAAPIFGRGRLLPPLFDQGLNDEAVADACAELVANCTCDISANPPGTPLLMTADWVEVADGVAAEPAPESNPAPSAPAVSGAPMMLWSGLGVLALLAATVLIGSVILMRRRGS